MTEKLTKIRKMTRKSANIDQIFPGVFIAKSDVGTGTIVGSAVFNILVIIGLCGLFCTAAIQLSWWPLARDSSCYLISIFVLIGVLYDGNVYWYEAAAMVSLYFCYILIMK